MVSGVGFSKQNNNAYFKHNNQQIKRKEPQSTEKHMVDLPGTKRLNLSPVTIGLLNGICWFGVGALCSKGMSKILKHKPDKLVDNLFNGAIGAFMGFHAYKVAKNEVKNV